MMKLFYVALISAAGICGYAATLSMNKDEKDLCEEGGGCVVITNNVLREKQNDAYRAGLVDGEKLCNLPKPSAS